MAHDVVIKNGLVVDGTGAPAQRADVAIDGDRVVEVGTVDASGAGRVIDAEGRHVTPGFVDVHTHLDAQIAWDPIAASSCYHGVTSVVLGNCGVTFAPVKPTDHTYLAELMESVEDIPADSIMSGLLWNWSTYGEYLDALDGMPKGINVGGLVGHCAVRYHVMGERSLDDPDTATAEDITAMVELVDEAMAAGALGFSTSRTYGHVTPDGRPVPGTFAKADELLALAGPLGTYQRGVFEGALCLGERDTEDLVNTRAEMRWLGEVCRSTGRPATYGIAQSYRRPELFRKVLEFTDEEAALGAELRPQTTVRAIGILYGLTHTVPWGFLPGWKEALRDKSVSERLAYLRNEANAAALVVEADAAEHNRVSPRWLYYLGQGEPKYRYTADDTLEAIAKARGVSPARAFIDIAIESDGAALWNYPALNQSDDAIDEMQHHPRIAMGLGDSGAHVGQIMDAGQTTFFLSNWIRDRQVFTIEEAIRRVTSDTAGIFGLEGRGLVAPGAFADINVIDLDGLRPHQPEYVNDFPGGAGRWIQKADGYDCTLVNGEVFMEGGEHAGALAGSVLRSGPDIR